MAPLGEKDTGGGAHMSDTNDKIRIVQETVAGKEITFAHVIGGPAPIIYQKLGLNPAIDYGAAHTGIAISDPPGLLAGFTTVINAYRPDRVTGQIALLAKEHRVERLVLGHPINMDGTRGPRSEKAQAMRQLLKETTGLPVVLWDERRTTIDAHQILMSSGKNAKKRKKVVDAVAASLILEGYLTYLKTHPEG